MARWIQDVEAGKPEVIGYTIIAGWWPTTFHRVMTLEVKLASASEGISLLTRQLCEAHPEKRGPARDYFVTCVHRVNRYGVRKSEKPECETEYTNREGAREGHRQIVAALTHGKRSLSRLISIHNAKNG